jgi:XTP/dITP diphosphohydrolase
LKIQRLVIATHNANKAGEMQQILSKRLPELTLLTLANYENAPEPEETGDTYEENAAIKALSAASFTGEWAVADDAGLEIEALKGAPGLYSKRFGGEEMGFPQKMTNILEQMRDLTNDQRRARFRCVVALAEPGGYVAPTLFSASCDGRIARIPSGSGGFGYDPIFYLPPLHKTMADLTAEQKHAISHRGKVLALLAEHLLRMT